MNESCVKVLGFEVLGYICSYVIMGNDIWYNMFVGVMIFSLIVFECVGLMFVDMDFIDIYEILVS